MEIVHFGVRSLKENFNCWLRESVNYGMFQVVLCFYLWEVAVF
jgi:hypothetical protein